MRVEANAAKKIAELFNEILVWSDIAKEELEAGKVADSTRWNDLVDDATLELADVYGIELPGLKFARTRWVRRAA